MLRGGHARAEQWRPATNCSRAVGVAEINFEIKNLPAKPVATTDSICICMVSKSETENYKLANPEAVDSVVENGIKGSANGNVFQASLHYSVAMEKIGNIRVKDSYCDSKEVSKARWQHMLYII